MVTEASDVLDQRRMRAQRSLSETPRPFLRWAGSKQKLLVGLVDHVPLTFGTYIEPFLGGGALFFLLEPEQAVVSDASMDLMKTYRAVRDGPEAVLRHLQRMKPLDRAQYYSIRSERSSERFARAAEFIYLNRSCWNGLYRVNMKGDFNVPYGSPQTNFIVPPENLRACAVAMRRIGVRVVDGDFELSLARAGDGDFVFLDPPYVTGHNNNGFIDYNRKLFGWNDQVRLARAAEEAANRGAKVMITNANHESVLELYSGFKVVELRRSSTLASSVTARRVVTEAIIKSY